MVLYLRCSTPCQIPPAVPPTTRMPAPVHSRHFCGWQIAGWLARRTQRIIGTDKYNTTNEQHNSIHSCPCGSLQYEMLSDHVATSCHIPPNHPVRFGIWTWLYPIGYLHFFWVLTVSKHSLPSETYLSTYPNVRCWLEVTNLFVLAFNQHFIIRDLENILR
jgi:hypothetical protein